MAFTETNVSFARITVNPVGQLRVEKKKKLEIAMDNVPAMWSARIEEIIGLPRSSTWMLVVGDMTSRRITTLSHREYSGTVH